MRQRESEPRRAIISRKQFVALAAIAVAGYFLISFGNLVLTAYRLNVEAEALRTDIKALSEENEALQLEVDGLEGQATVEAIAREELGWTKPGETQVVVDVEPGSSVVLPETERPISPPVANWRRWADLLLQPDS